MAPEIITTAILTISDRCSTNEQTDESGQNLQHILSSRSLFNSTVAARACVPDDIEKIKECLIKWCDELKLNLILTTGGTGFSARDVTPEATKAVITKEAPGMALAIIKGSLDITPMAMLSRLVCGIRGQTIIVNLPGSTKGAQESLSFIAPAIPHAVDQLCERREKTAEVHSAMKKCHSHGNQKGLQSFPQVARRPRQSPYPMVDVEEAQAIIIGECFTTEVEEVAIDALHRVLVETVHAFDPLPPFPASIMDGYAVLASDGSGPRLVMDAVSAGDDPTSRVCSGQCVRISTGAPVPYPCDAVVPVENTVLLRASPDGSQEIEIEVLKAATVGQDIRAVGSDIEKGQVVLEQGHLLEAPELGLLAAVGQLRVPVHVLPKVALLSTGNEVVPPGKSLEPGQIRDSNKTTLLALLRANGFASVDAGIAHDNRSDTRTKLQEALDAADVVISSGGVSMGEKDYLKDVLLEDFAATIHFGRVCMKPGKPTTFATLTHRNKKKLVFALPGNPVSCATTCHLFVLPALRKMAGHRRPFPSVAKAKLSHGVALDPRPEYHRAMLTWSASPLPVASSTGNQRSSRLLSFVGCNALLALPACTTDCSHLEAGSVVEALLLST
ncbi:gephyrin-like isoform X2 [Ornithodoros turicata]|uniref:gephyrin-like isoform X2 n=1 Tax=Ornithodoros turicata TaxID=34597 RepID=UPI00313A28C9